jgi:hypothetical protein
MAATPKEQQMNPLTRNVLLTASFLSAATLMLAGPAGARPILDGAELGDTPAPVTTKPDLEHEVLFGGSAVVPDAVDRAVAVQQQATTSGTVVLRKSGSVIVTGQQQKQQPAWLRALMLRSQAMNEYYAGTRSVAGTSSTTAGKPAWLAALEARSQAMNEYYAKNGDSQTYYAPRDPAQKPGWLKALEARSEGMNEYYGAAGTTATRPDDRAVPRPISREPFAAIESSGDGSRFGDVAIGTLGGLGVAFALFGGTLVYLRSRRHDDRVALP